VNNMDSLKITAHELNLMSELDGEEPFAEEEDSEFVSLESRAEFINAMKFTQEVRDGLSTGLIKEAIPQDWVTMIQDYSSDEKRDASKSVNDGSGFFSEVLSAIQSFFNPRYAFGGAFALALGIGLVVQMQPQSQSWESSYASLEGLPSLQDQVNQPKFTGDYFETPQVTVRGLVEQSSSIADIARNLALGEEAKIYSGDELDPMIRSLQAAELNGKTFSLLEAGDEKLWLSVRGPIIAIDGQDKGECKLVQVSLEKDGNPDASVKNYFLQYCNQRWSNKLVPLGQSQ
jgi:hypothetical protein